jgi:hypothetical protein
MSAVSDEIRQRGQYLYLGKPAASARNRCRACASDKAGLRSSARSVFVTATSVAGSMSLEDRDWYRAEVARRLSASSRASGSPAGTGDSVALHSRARTRVFQVARNTAIAAMAVVAIGLVLLPATMVPRCDLDSWTSMPVACWRLSWSALSELVAENMAATFGWPVTIVESGGSPAPPPPTLPNIIRPSQH